MKFTLIFLFLSLNAWSQEVCHYGLKNQCHKDSYCVRQDENHDICQPMPEYVPTIAYPFSRGVYAIVDQGPLGAKGSSHTFLNTAFALDLIGDTSQFEKKILAGTSGKVVVYDSCLTKNDRCGAGFGNHVKVLNEDGVMVLYAHMKRIFIKDGSEVAKGDELGIEGETGWTGPNNPHLHVSVHYDWRVRKLSYWKNVGYLPPSIPFKINDCQKDLDVRTVTSNRAQGKGQVLCSF